MTIIATEVSIKALPDGRFEVVLPDSCEKINRNTRYTTTTVRKRLEDLLGYSVSKTTLWRWMSEERIPFQKPGTRPVFVEADLVEWAESKKKVAIL